MSQTGNLKAKVIDILSTIFNKEVDENFSSANDDSWDSLALLEVIVTLEEEFNIKIPVEKIPEITSVKKIVEVIESIK